MSLSYRNNGAPRQLSFSEFPITNTQIENDSNSASFIITRENQFSVFAESITIYSGVKFAKISFGLQSKVEGVNFDWLHTPIFFKGVFQCKMPTA